MRYASMIAKTFLVFGSYPFHLIVWTWITIPSPFSFTIKPTSETLTFQTPSAVSAFSSFTSPTIMTDPYPTTTPQRTLTIPTLPQYRLPLHVSPTQITAAPEKRILEPTDMPTFRVSSARLEILLFIMTCTQHAILQVSNNKHPLAQWLQQMEQAITLFPSENDTAKQRFGSPKFREWHQYITTEAQNWIQETYKFEDGNITAALTHFMSTSFGSPQRLDYGTGHELTFFQLLGTLYKFQLMSIEECLDVIPRYYGVVDAIITHYKLEPAGSHGVWGLDDHFHIAYIIGAAQLTSKSSHAPTHVTVNTTLIIVKLTHDQNIHISRQNQQ